jgi:hypothetical protein
MTKEQPSTSSGCASGMNLPTSRLGILVAFTRRSRGLGLDLPPIQQFTRRPFDEWALILQASTRNLPTATLCGRVAVKTAITRRLAGPKRITPDKLLGQIHLDSTPCLADSTAYEDRL